MNVSKRMGIAALVAALALGSADPGAALAAGARIVDDDYPLAAACKGARYATIQAAVDSIMPGKSGPITVCAGTYTENVSMTGLGKIKLTGKPGAIIASPGASPLILATDTSRLAVQGFTLDGKGSSPLGLILTQDTNAIVTGNVVENAINSYGVYADVNSGKHSLAVSRSSFSGLFGGVYAENIAGTSAVQVSRNDVAGCQEGVGMLTAAAATGVIRMSGNRMQGSDMGIQLTGPVTGVLSGNTIYGFLTGITLQGANRTRVMSNVIQAAGDGFVGIRIAANASASANSNQVSGNTITDPGALYTETVGVSLYNQGGSLNKTVIKGSKLINIDTPYDHTGDTNTTLKSNTCSPALPCVTP